MRALKAKRRFLRWARYQHRCWALAGRRPWQDGVLLSPGENHPLLPGYARASWAWSTEGRHWRQEWWVGPRGIREVYDPVTGVRY